MFQQDNTVFGRTLLPHERVDHICRSNPNVFSPRPNNENDKRALDLPYIKNNAILRMHGPNSVVLARGYVDGPQLSKSGRQFLAFYWADIYSGVRYLITTLRKSCLCKCCGGRCTIDAALSVIVWSFSCLRLGLHPDCGPPGTVLDGARLLRGASRQALAKHGDMVECGCDWKGVNNLMHQKLGHK